MKKSAILIGVLSVILVVCFAFGAFADDYTNVCNQDSITKKQYSSSGKLTAGPTYAVTGFIDVKSGDTVYFSNVNPSMAATTPVLECFKGTAFVSKVLIKDVNVEKYSRLIGVGSYKIPEGVNKIRINMRLIDADTFVCTINQPMNIDQYYDFIGAEKPQFRTESPLYGKSVVFFGDSITEAYCESSVPALKDTAGWPGRIGTYNDMQWINKGLGGASLSNCRQSNTVINQIKNSRGTKNYDIVILHGGVNDAWDSCKIGKMSDSFDIKDFDQSTFAGGLEATIYEAKQLYNLGHTKIGYIINFQITAGYGQLRNMGPYFDVAKQICDKWEIPYLDLYTNEDLNKNQLKVNSPANFANGDLIHPNTAGYDILYPVIEAWMETLVAGDSAVTPTPTPEVTPTPTVPEKTETPKTPEATTALPPATTPEATQTAEPESGNTAVIIIAVVAIAAVAAVAAFLVLKKKK